MREKLGKSGGFLTGANRGNGEKQTKEKDTKDTKETGIQGRQTFGSCVPPEFDGVTNENTQYTQST